MNKKTTRRPAARRPNTANTVTGAAGHPVPPVPPFHSRRTLVEIVRDNMAFAHRLSVLHRVGIIAHNSATKTREEVKQFLDAAIHTINVKAKHSEQISGVIVLYPAHTMIVLTGTARTFGLFTYDAGKMLVQFLREGRLLYFHGNVNQVLYGTIHFRCKILSYIALQRITEKVLFVYGDPPVLIMKSAGRDFDQMQYHVQMMVKRITNLCQVVAQNDVGTTQHRQDSDEDADDELPFEPIDVQKLLPEVALIEYVLQVDLLMTLKQFLDIFEFIPPFEHYDEKVWPIPYDFTPDNIYDNGKYDINLIFGKQAPKPIAE